MALRFLLLRDANTNDTDARSKPTFTVKLNMAEGSEPRGPVRLETEQLNSIKAAFQSLDESNTGQVAKSRLQVLCASLCRDCEIAYTTDDLDAYKPGQKTMGSGDLVDYLQEELLPKGE